MILTKKELKDAIKQDEARYGKRKFQLLGWLLGDEIFGTLLFLRRLRKTEYYLNKSKKNALYKIPFYISFVLYRRLWDHYKLHVPLNVVSPGLYIPHRAGGVYINASYVGSHFTISSGCVLGSKGDKNAIPYVGDNVECCIGSKIIGLVKIADNSIIAPNSVVIKDVPSATIVSGVPAVVIKQKQDK